MVVQEARRVDPVDLRLFRTGRPHDQGRTARQLGQTPGRCGRARRTDCRFGRGLAGAQVSEKKGRGGSGAGDSRFGHERYIDRYIDRRGKGLRPEPDSLYKNLKHRICSRERREF